ncbi:MAG: response regulator [Anaerolineae bacterium]|nr:response regulator [Phycisphaerae bacterium]
MSKVLIVDDDLDNAELLRIALERVGYRASCAMNGQAALLAVTNDPPDLIMLDIRMPVMDGITLLQILRSYLRWHDLPVVVVTAMGQGPDLDKLEQFDVSAVYHKAQYELTDLVNHVREIVPLN